MTGATDMPDEGVRSSRTIKPLNICMMVVGTHGDVLPFIAIGEIFTRDGHRVRIATHEMFRDKVTQRGLDFFCIGADPVQMSEFMVKHKSLMISNPLKAIPALGDLPKQLRLAKDIIGNSWRAVSDKNFVADAIIANPICWAHVHVAEKLDVPLHIMFPQPWLPTREFPHPFSGWDFGRPPSDRNVFSYNLMDSMTWLPLHFAINKFRKTQLGLPAISMSDGMAGLLKTRCVPHSFLWSEALVPFPPDWPAFADIVGCIHNPYEDYNPPKKLDQFLKDGPPPILVTFGSMRIQKPGMLGNRIRWAAKKTGIRVLVQSGWSDLSEGVKKDSRVCFIGPCPHTWLIPRVAAGVHHGGAGTTHAFAQEGKPMLVCPFFGDQPFWGHAIYRTGAGLQPVPIDTLSQEKLAKAFTTLVSGEMQAAAQALSAKMQLEDGAATAVKSFYRGLKTRRDNLRRAARRTARGPDRSSLRRSSLRQHGFGHTNYKPSDPPAPDSKMATMRSLAGIRLDRTAPRLKEAASRLNLTMPRQKPARRNSLSGPPLWSDDKNGASALSWPNLPSGALAKDELRPRSSSAVPPAQAQLPGVGDSTASTVLASSLASSQLEASQRVRSTTRGEPAGERKPAARSGRQTTRGGKAVKDSSGQEASRSAKETRQSARDAARKPSSLEAVVREAKDVKRSGAKGISQNPSRRSSITTKLPPVYNIRATAA